jgi:phosphoglycolate phosphatase
VRFDQRTEAGRFEAVIFDLDGTLVDTLEDLADAVNRVLIGRRMPAHDYDEYRYMIGGGMRQLVAAALPVAQRSEAIISECLDQMIAYYRENSLAKTRLYDGVAELLHGLRQRGVRLAVLSNKANDLTGRIVSALVSPGTFDVVVGARPDVPLKPDPAGALLISARLGVAPAGVAFLGDSGTDMITATNAGMIALGAAWGFRTERELHENGARLVLTHPRELLALYTA